MDREIIGDGAGTPVDEIIVKRAIDEMHVEAIKAQLREMQAGKIEELNAAYGIDAGGLTYLARHLWNDYQKRHK